MLNFCWLCNVFIPDIVLFYLLMQPSQAVNQWYSFCIADVTFQLLFHVSAEINILTPALYVNLFLLCLSDDISGPYPEQFDDVMDFIEATIGRLRRSSEPREGSRGRKEQRQRGAANTGGTRGEGRGHDDRRRGRGRGGSRGGKGGRGEKGRERIMVQTRGCLLKEVHLNVTDLGLGYQTKEELIFRYCSGPCVEAETNYDKILNNLTHNKKLDKDTPSRTCCRPIAFDDDLSFLDDNVVYHTLKKHSARKCGCVWGRHIGCDKITDMTSIRELRITFTSLYFRGRDHSWKCAYKVEKRKGAVSNFCQ